MDTTVGGPSRLDPFIVDVPPENGSLDSARDVVPERHHVHLARFRDLGELRTLVLCESGQASFFVV